MSGQTSATTARKRKAPDRFAPGALKRQKVAPAAAPAKLPKPGRKSAVSAAAASSATTSAVAAVAAAAGKSKSAAGKSKAARPAPIKCKRSKLKPTAVAKPVELLDAKNGAPEFVEDTKRLIEAFGRTAHKNMRLTSAVVLPHSSHAGKCASSPTPTARDSVDN